MSLTVAFLLLVSLVFYTLYNVFIKASSGSIHQVVGAVILQVTAALFGGLMLLYLKMTGKELFITQKGVVFALLAGVAIGIAEIDYFFVYSKGTSASVAVPVVWGGVILLGAVLGILFFQEALTAWKALACTLIVAGICLLFLK